MYITHNECMILHIPQTFTTSLDGTHTHTHEFFCTVELSFYLQYTSIVASRLFDIACFIQNITLTCIKYLQNE